MLEPVKDESFSFSNYYFSSCFLIRFYYRTSNSIASKLIFLFLNFNTTTNNTGFNELLSFFIQLFSYLFLKFNESKFLIFDAIVFEIFVLCSKVWDNLTLNTLRSKVPNKIKCGFAAVISTRFTISTSGTKVFHLQTCNQIKSSS